VIHQQSTCCSGVLRRIERSAKRFEKSSDLAIQIANFTYDRAGCFRFIREKVRDRLLAFGMLDLEISSVWVIVRDFPNTVPTYCPIRRTWLSRKTNARHVAGLSMLEDASKSAGKLLQIAKQSGPPPRVGIVQSFHVDLVQLQSASCLQFISRNAHDSSRLQINQHAEWHYLDEWQS